MQRLQCRRIFGQQANSPTGSREPGEDLQEGTCCTILEVCLDELEGYLDSTQEAMSGVPREPPRLPHLLGYPASNGEP